MSRRIGYQDLLEWARDILLETGYSGDAAQITAHSLTEADARGIYSHGTAVLKLYLGHSGKGGCLNLSAGEPSVVMETPLSAVLDGHSGVGFFIAERAAALCAEKARRAGIGIVTVKNANHYGFAGYWSEKIAKQGFIGITSSNTARTVCPTRSALRCLGTNPIAFAFPQEDGQDLFMLDMATSAIAQGKLNRSNSWGKEGAMPEGFVIDESGAPVHSVKRALELLADPLGNGGLLPLGGSEYNRGYKGYGLSLLVELFTAGLSGGVTSMHIPLNSKGICFFFMAVSPALFGDPEAVCSHIRAIFREYSGIPAIEAGKPVLLPNGPESAARKDAAANGILVTENVYRVLEEIAERFGMKERLEAITR